MQSGPMRCDLSLHQPRWQVADKLWLLRTDIMNLGIALPHIPQHFLLEALGRGYFRLDAHRIAVAGPHASGWWPGIFTHMPLPQSSILVMCAESV